MVQELTLDQLTEEYRQILRKQNHSDHTITAYLTSIRMYYRHYSELTIPNLKAYRSFLLKTYSLESPTCAHCISFSLICNTTAVVFI